ncbi:MAG: hypothetical protein V9G24_01815 [Rhodoblastus sp.]
MTSADDRTPILVGAGAVTDMTTPPEQARSPFDLVAQAAQKALADCGAPELAGAIDTIALLRFFSDTSHRFATKLGDLDQSAALCSQDVSASRRRAKSIPGTAGTCRNTW